ncbi:MAG: diguanylate cyclase, partial [Anaeroplasmataceae bacterium]|nr:diguanylate cyclase [Anaeroplasmataceae bacterium]
SAGVYLNSNEELRTLLKHLYKISERERLFCIETSERYYANEDGSLMEFEADEAYIHAGRTGAYDRAFMTKGRASEIAYRGNKLYYIQAIYVVCNSFTYILEIIMSLRDDVLIENEFIKAEAIAKIDSKANKKYLDIPTNALNCLFYEEQMISLTGSYSVVTIVSNPKEDDIQAQLKELATSTRECIRSTDVLLRMEDNMFVVILEKINELNFKIVAQKISERLGKLNQEIYISAYFANGKLEDIVSASKKNIDQAKKNNVNFIFQELKK